MKLRAHLDDLDHELELRLVNGRAEVNIDGRSYQVNTSEPTPGIFLIRNRNKIYQCRVQDNHARGTIEVHLRGHNYHVTVVDPKRLRSGQNSEDLHHGSADIKAPMPGKVVRLLVDVGAAVEAGSGILVVEAMKMQNEMKSPRSGLVVSISVAPGDTVNAGDVLAVIE